MAGWRPRRLVVVNIIARMRPQGKSIQFSVGGACSTTIFWGGREVSGSPSAGAQGASGAGALQRLRELMLASTSQIVECGSSTAAFSVPGYDTSGVDRSLVRTKYRIDAIASTIPFTANSNSVA